VLLPLVLTASGSGGIGLAGSTVRELPVESLTCKACGRHTVTRDLPPIGIDVVAVLEQLAAAETARPSPGVGAISPMCACGSPILTLSTVVALTVHTAGATMLGEVSPGNSAATPGGTLTCGACSRSWDVTRSDLSAHVREAVSAFIAALSRGDVRLVD
jgi:hypothetical protein